METVSVATAAAMIGVSTQSIYGLIRQGRLSRVDGPGPIRLVSGEVRTLARNRVDPEQLAAQVVGKLRPPPPEMVTLTDGRQVPHPSQYAVQGDRIVSLVRKGGVGVVPYLPPAAAQLWGLAVLTAAARPVPTGTCRTCVADVLARGWETLRPADDAATRILLGTPCGKDRARWAAQRDAASQRVHHRLEEMRQKAARQAQERVSQVAAQLRDAQSAAALVARQSGAGAVRPRAITASATDPGETPPAPRLDPRRDITASRAREIEARRARREELYRRDGV